MVLRRCYIMLLVINCTHRSSTSTACICVSTDDAVEGCLVYVRPSVCLSHVDIVIFINASNTLGSVAKCVINIMSRVGAKSRQSNPNGV